LRFSSFGRRWSFARGSSGANRLCSAWRSTKQSTSVAHARSPTRRSPTAGVRGRWPARRSSASALGVTAGRQDRGPGARNGRRGVPTCAGLPGADEGGTAPGSSARWTRLVLLSQRLSRALGRRRWPTTAPTRSRESFSCCECRRSPIARFRAARPRGGSTYWSAPLAP